MHKSGSAILTICLAGGLLIVGGLLSMTGIGAICGLPMILAASFVLMFGWLRLHNAATREALKKVRESARAENRNESSSDQLSES